MTEAFEWLVHQVELMERKPQDVALDFEGDLPLKGKTVDGAEYEICLDPLMGEWNVWVTSIDGEYEVLDRVFHGTKNECLSYLYWHMEVDA